MKTTPLSAALVVLAAISAPALAQQKTQDPTAQPPVAAVSGAEMTDGEIRKVDTESRKITIRHGEIRNLDMPPMTMVFQVRDASLLDKIKVGDKVRFVAEKSDAGYVVTEIQAAK